MKSLDKSNRVFLSTILFGKGLGMLVGIFLLSGIATGTTITADNLEYFKEEEKYVATGNVIIDKGNSLVKADEAVYFHNTGDTFLTGHVSIDDRDYLINTEEADFNLDEKTGNLHNAVIFFKSDKFWISGVNMHKLGENHYYAKTAYFTTCDSEAYRTAQVINTSDIPASQKPDWCFKGDDADIVVGNKMTTKNATYRVKDLPVLYSPYFSAPVGTGRESGLLIPTVGNSTTKGVRFSPSYFWAIDENKDATLTADYYSKRGLGTGVEYRFLDLNHEGTWYAYHIRDNELHKDFVEVRGTDRYTTGNIKAFLDVNYINNQDFYQEYPKDFKTSISRFLQSTAEVSAPLNNSRLYFLSQYWVNLQIGTSSGAPQKLPEIGYILNPTAVGPSTIFTLSADAANFYQNHAPHGQRMDIKPDLAYAFGDTLRLSQSISLRETAYNLLDNEGFGTTPHREMIQYNAQAQMRLLKNYGSYLHIVEPSMEFTFIPSAKSLPLFDETELYAKTTLMQFILMNKFMFSDMDIAIRFSQPYDFNPSNSTMIVNNFNAVATGITIPQGSSNHLQPTRLEGSASGQAIPVNVTFDIAYDVRNNRLNNINSGFNFKVFRDITLGLGERYSQVDDLMLFTIGITAPIDKHWMLTTTTWYDAKGPGLRDLSIRTTYKEQCWTANAVITRRPASQITPVEYSYMFLLEMKGVGAFKL